MVINNTPRYNEIWDFVYNKLGFSPSCKYRGHSFNVPLPFKIDDNYSVYSIENMSNDQCDFLEDTIREIFINTTKVGRKIFALDWQHSSFLYDPRNISEQKSCRVNDERYTDGGYYAFFPAFYPDGDYYFFIEEKFEFGYLGHPWRQEIWIFGCDLMKEIERVYQKLGWKKLR